jgi:superfamily II RNA helicase
MNVHFLLMLTQLQKFRDELKNRSRVLKMLGHIDADGVLRLKGRAACFIDTGDELLVTELMFNGTFNDLDHHQVAALASCFIPCDKSNEQIRLRGELSKPLQQLQDAARRIAEVVNAPSAALGMYLHCTQLALFVMWDIYLPMSNIVLFCPDTTRMQAGCEC